MCQNIQNMKITPVTDICSKGNFVKKRVLTHPLKNFSVFIYLQNNYLSSC